MRFKRTSVRQHTMYIEVANEPKAMHFPKAYLNTDRLKIQNKLHKTHTFTQNQYFVSIKKELHFLLPTSSAQPSQSGPALIINPKSINRKNFVRFFMCLLKYGQIVGRFPFNLFSISISVGERKIIFFRCLRLFHMAKLISDLKSMADQQVKWLFLA